jgi:hypothetical protein
MQTRFQWPELSGLIQKSDSEASLAQALLSVMQTHLDELTPSLIQDLSHISHFAQFDGGMTVLSLEALAKDRFKLRYQYDWALNWNCAGETGSGTVTESMRFRLDQDHLELLPLKLD